MYDSSLNIHVMDLKIQAWAQDNNNNVLRVANACYQNQLSTRAGIFIFVIDSMHLGVALLVLFFRCDEFQPSLKRIHCFVTTLC